MKSINITRKRAGADSPDTILNEAAAIRLVSRLTASLLLAATQILPAGCGGGTTSSTDTSSNSTPQGQPPVRHH